MDGVTSVSDLLKSSFLDIDLSFLPCNGQMNHDGSCRHTQKTDGRYDDRQQPDRQTFQKRTCGLK